MRRQLRSMAACALALAAAAAAPAEAQQLNGFNIITTKGHPYGGQSAGRALSSARRLGASTVAIVSFLYQPDPTSADIRRGSDMDDTALRQAIRQARGAGFRVIVKPHVWIPHSWAGAVEPATEDAWALWFLRYRAEILRIAGIAAQEGAQAFSIGTELTKTNRRPEWREVIAAARAVFPRTLFYVAHNVEEAESVPFWADLDMIGVTLYPPLGGEDDRDGRLRTMISAGERLDKLSERMGKPILVAEVGLRSAQGATVKPWESAEERMAPADLRLQAVVLADWLDVLNRPSVRGVLVWRWFTDPAAGGGKDTDFTVQGKPAEGILFCAWTPNACRGL